MPIVIKHGAEIEGKGIAYGAAARAAYIREQERREREREHKARRLGDIGSILSTAGAISSFIPGMQPVAAGLSVAGGILGQRAGGRGDVTGKAIAAGAQGIASVYHAYGEKLKAKQEEWDSWKKRQDYTHELSSLKQQENLDEEIRMVDAEFNQRYRNEERIFADKKNAILESVGLSMFKAFDLESLDLALLEGKGPQSNAYRQIRNTLWELGQNKNATIAQLKDMRDKDPAITLREANKQMAEKAETLRRRNIEEQKIADNKAEKEIQLAKERASAIRTHSNIVADTEAEISQSDALSIYDKRKLNAEAYQAKIQQRNFSAGQLNIAITGEVKALATRLANGDPEAMAASVDIWIAKRVAELVEANRLRAENFMSEYQWNMQLGGLTFYYEGIAKKELDKLLVENRASLLQELSELNIYTQYGIR